MKNFIILFLLVLSTKSYSQGVYILTFENPSQSNTHFIWDVRISAVSAPFVLLSSNIRYNFNNTALSTTTTPTFDVTLPGYAFDASSFLGTAPNRYVNLGFGPTANNTAVSVNTTGVVIGTISHPRGSGMVNGLPTDTRIRAWNVPAYVNYNPTASAGNCTRIFTLDSPSVPVQAGTPENLENVLLPVKLKTFSAEKVGERTAKLDWVSSTEVNVSHYEVERSLDALFFDNIGKVIAVGNSTTESVYDFLDKKVPAVRTNTLVYYRLKMVDMDGSYEYSDVKGLNFSNNVLTNVSMYPNPTAQMLNIDVNLPDFTEGDADLQILDATGKLVLNKKVTGNGIETIDMGKYSNGVYHVILKQDGKIFNEKVIKVE